MVGPGPSPKRRRTDYLVTTAQDVAQANSTLYFFTGQRHNRWMQGWDVAHASSNGESAFSTAPETQRPAVSPTCLANGDAFHSDHAAGAAGRANARSNSTIPISMSAPTSGKTAMAAATAARPGLPSPVTSEDPASPSIASHHPTTPARVAPTVGPSSLDGHSHPAPPLRSSSTSQPDDARIPLLSANHHHVVQSSPLPNLPNGQPVPHILPTRTPDARAAASNPPQTFPTGPRQSITPVDDSMLSRAAMLQRFHDFNTAQAKLNNVDKGRLLLLQEAIERRDMFFIVLSQIYTLRNTPHMVPKSAQKLDPKCFGYLDRLLTPNNLVSPEVLAWLARFPAPILRIYFTPQDAPVYERCVLNVVHFLSLLPQCWGQFEYHCLARRAPPLVQELASNLHLLSPVLQSTVFRMIARLVLEATSSPMPERGAEELEKLHRMDQATFLQGHRRSPDDIFKAQQALANAVATWKQYEKFATQARLPNGRGNVPTAFGFPPEIISIFQPPTPMQFEQGQQRALMPARSNLQQQHSPAFSSRQVLPSSLHTISGDFTPMPPSAHDSAQHELLQHQASRAVMGQPSRGPPQCPARPLFPPHGNGPRAQPTNPDPNLTALHQAHLRSPKCVTAASGQAHDGTARLYRHVKSFALSPTRIDKDLPIQTQSFHVPRESFAKIPKYSPSQIPGEPPSRSLTEVSETYRLRCAAYPPTGFPSEQSWVAADGQWPESLYFDFNGTILEPRRKLHHNRYLPIDLSALVKAGENVVKVIVNRPTTDTRLFEYVVAVEIVGAMSHSSIKKRLAHNTIRAKDSLAAMKKSLSREHHDDEIAITSSNLTIQLFEPYSNSQIFDLPVRGAACAHKDCFDLETFLRLCRRESADGPTVVDCWRCPLCRGDVRPHTLVVDGFLVDVRRQLEQEGLLDTRAITVEADGSWQGLGVRSPSLAREERGDSATSGVGKRVTEVIKLD